MTSRHTHGLRCLALGLATLTVLIASGSALGQKTEYTLSEDGEWQETRSPEPGTDEATIAEARRLLAEESPAAAKSVLDEWIEQNETTSNRFLPEAYRLRGDARLAMDREFNAMYDYEAVVREFPGSEEFLVALERELDIALRYINGLRIRIAGFRLENAEDLGVEFLIRVQERAPGSALAERAAIELADYYYRKREMDLAGQSYDLYIENFPQGPNLERAMKRRIFANIAVFKGPKYDASSLIDAREQIQAFSNVFPAEAEQTGIDDALLARIDESAAAQMLETAEWYLRRNEPAAARLVLKRLVRRHPRSLAASRSIQMMRDRGWLEALPDAAPSTEAVSEGSAEDQEGEAADEAPSRDNPEDGSES